MLVDPRKDFHKKTQILTQTNKVNDYTAIDRRAIERKESAAAIDHHSVLSPVSPTNYSTGQPAFKQAKGNESLLG